MSESAPLEPQPIPGAKDVVSVSVDTVRVANACELKTLQF